MSRYRIPRLRTRVELRVSNSRFIATVDRASTVPEAQAVVRAIRDEMPHATHHVYAFKVGYGASVTEGMSDDGEPSGTAGPPALAVVRGSDVGDVVLVITRYFGGTKLGTGGLVSAYTEAAKAAFDALEIEEKVVRRRFAIVIPYAAFEPLKRVLDDHDAVIEDESYEADVRIACLLAEPSIDAVGAALRDLTAGRSRLEPCDDGS